MANKAHLRILEQGSAKWNEWRKKNDRLNPDLNGADLSRWNLNGADFNSAKLCETKLNGAFLIGVRFSGANLNETKFDMADLTGADFGPATIPELSKTPQERVAFQWTQIEQTRLDNVSFRGSHLLYVDFTLADLNDVDFTGCVAGSSRFLNVNLSQCIGLETVEHRGPSHIGIDTIYRSEGNIPENFLRSAGVPEPFIANMKALVGAMSPIEFYSCFISYSHADKAFARRLHDALQSKGIRCWLDEHQLLPGDDIYHEVDRGIRLWDKMLLCCSESSLKSWWVDNEIGTAFEKEQQLMKDRGTRVQVLVPLNLDGYLFSDKWKSGYQSQVRRRLAADFTDASDAGKFDQQVETLIRALRADEGARERPPKQRL